VVIADKMKEAEALLVREWVHVREDEREEVNLVVVDLLRE
jgi:hypothetical protein